MASNNASKGRKIKATGVVNVKKEKVDDPDIDEDKDEDGDDESEDDPGHDGIAKRIYHKALKMLKFKLYFENFFPTDTEKDALPYSCWVSAVESIDQVDGGSAAACKMFYGTKYGRRVCASAVVILSFTILNPSPHLLTLSSTSVSVPSETRLSRNLETVITYPTAQRRRNLLR